MLLHPPKPPSSHDSPTVTNPSPHIGLQTPELREEKVLHYVQGEDPGIKSVTGLTVLYGQRMQFGS